MHLWAWKLWTGPRGNLAVPGMLEMLIILVSCAVSRSLFKSVTSVPGNNWSVICLQVIHLVDMAMGFLQQNPSWIHPQTPISPLFVCWDFCDRCRHIGRWWLSIVCISALDMYNSISPQIFFVLKGGVGQSGFSICIIWLRTSSLQKYPYLDLWQIAFYWVDVIQRRITIQTLILTIGYNYCSLCSADPI